MKTIKRLICLFLAFAALMALGIVANAAVSAVVSNQALEIDGIFVRPASYNINGENYFRIRDLAYLLSDSSARFSVDYDEAARSVRIATGDPYAPIGSELQSLGKEAQQAVSSPQAIYIDGQKAEALTVYLIRDCNFFRLRDLADVLGFTVDYDEAGRRIILTTSAAEVGDSKNENIGSIADYGDTVLNIYMVLLDGMPQMQENGIDFVNYWMSAAYAITKMYKYNDYATAAAIVDCMMDTFSRNGYFPRPAYSTFAYGWVSGMDAPPIAIASQMLYEHTGEEKYKDFALQLLDFIPKDVSEHGFTASVNGKRWLFEYADTRTNDANGKFVLNGSMVATLSTSILADYFNSEKLRVLVEESTENYKEMMDQYLFRNHEWCYYMLNTKTVNQPHYVIFEIRLCDALFEMTGDAFYQEQAAIRREMLLRYYKGYLYTDDTGSHSFSFLRGGAPHYYYNDLYETKVDMFDDAGQLIKTETVGGRKLTDAVIQASIPEGVSKVTWTAKSGTLFSVLIGELQLENGYDVVSSEYAANVDLAASADGAFNNEGDLVLINNTGKANLTGKLPAPVPSDPETIFVIEFDNLSDLNCTMDMTLYDSAGSALNRTLIQLQSGKCFAAFGLPGFLQKETDLIDISSFRLRVFTTAIPKDTESKLRIGNVYVFHNTWEYMQYCKQTDCTALWRET